MKQVCHLVILFCFVSNFCGAQYIPQMRYSDKIRIREAIRIQDTYGERIWESFTKSPLALILIEDSVEFLMYHPYPSSDFVFSEKDSILRTDIFYRKRTFPEHFLATFPAVNGVNCIVVGTPEKTNKHSSSWIITLLHERFHQFQFNHPNYYSAVDALQLSNGDETGMWQLNYPFPYQDSSINQQYNLYTKALTQDIQTDAVQLKKGSKLRSFIAKQQLKQLLSPAHYRYLSFQLWQEGVAKYTEFKFLELLQQYTPSKELEGLSDYIPFDRVKASFFESELKVLQYSLLYREKRVCFYAVGWAEALLLDRLNPNWKSQYFNNPFNLDPFFETSDTNW